MEANEVLENAVYAGKILLESGAEIYRVEETIQRIALNCGMYDADAFVLPTGIMVSVKKDGEIISKITRVRNRSINLDKIDKVNALSRNISETKYDTKLIYNQLKEIDQLTTYTLLIKILAAAIGASGFAILFRGSIIDVVISFFVGIIVFSAKYFSTQYQINFFIANVIASFLGVISSTTVTQFFGNNDTIIISSLMLLVPGLVITNAIRDSVAQDLGAALNRLLETVLIGCAIALGAILAITLASLMGFIL